MTPRPVRNNNPGDLDAGEHWQGLMPYARLTPVQHTERFAVFERPEWGFRALVVLLHNYRVLYGADTVRKVINRFAPPTENPTDAYANVVAKSMSEALKRAITPDTTINVADHDTMFALAKAITTDETGGWAPYWTDTQLAKGMSLAGFELRLGSAA